MWSIPDVSGDGSLLAGAVTAAALPATVEPSATDAAPARNCLREVVTQTL
jgi:hypothetical protein